MQKESCSSCSVRLHQIEPNTADILFMQAATCNVSCLCMLFRDDQNLEQQTGHYDDILLFYDLWLPRRVCAIYLERCPRWETYTVSASHAAILVWGLGICLMIKRISLLCTAPYPASKVVPLFGESTQLLMSSKLVYKLNSFLFVNNQTPNFLVSLAMASGRFLNPSWEGGKFLTLCKPSSLPNSGHGKWLRAC